MPRIVAGLASADALSMRSQGVIVPDHLPTFVMQSPPAPGR